MRKGTRTVVVALASVLCAAAAMGQDPIDIVADSDELYAEPQEVGGSTRPGRSMRIRSDVVDLSYRMYANIDADPELEMVMKVTYDVISISGPGSNANVIELQPNGKLRFTVNGEEITQRCDPHVDPPEGCSGSGMPSQLYGNLAGGATALTAYETAGSAAISVPKVELRQLVEQQQQSQ